MTEESEDTSYHSIQKFAHKSPPCMVDFAVPSQLLEVRNVHMKPFQKKGQYPPLALLQYTTNNYTLKNFTILTPPLMIYDWNSNRGHLQLLCDHHAFFKAKFHTIQEYLISTLFVNQTLLLGVQI